MDIDRRTILKGLLGMPILGMTKVDKLLSVTHPIVEAQDVEPRGICQQMHYWRAHLPPKAVIVLRKDVFDQLYKCIDTHFIHTAVAQAGYDHLLFGGSPVLWFPDKEWFTYWGMHEDFKRRTGADMYVIDEAVRW